MTEKEVSMDAHVWGHVATIIFHTLIGLYLIYLSTYSTGMITMTGIGTTGATITRPNFDVIQYPNVKRIVLVIGIVLTVFSLLSLWPILMKYDKIIIE